MWADGNTTGGTPASIIVCWGWILETGVLSLTHPVPGGWAGPGSAALQHWKHCPEEWWPGDAESTPVSAPAPCSAGLSQCRGVSDVNTHQTPASPIQLLAQQSPPQHVSSQARPPDTVQCAAGWEQWGAGPDEEERAGVVHCVVSQSGAEEGGVWSVSDSVWQIRDEDQWENCDSWWWRSPGHWSASVLWIKSSCTLFGSHTGDLVSWGAAGEDRLGQGRQVSLTAPPGAVHVFRSVSGVGVSSVSCGKQHSVIISQAGVYSWGCNKYGQLGLGVSPVQLNMYAVPRHVAGLQDVHVTHMSVGQFHTVWEIVILSIQEEIIKLSLFLKSKIMFSLSFS